MKQRSNNLSQQLIAPDSQLSLWRKSPTRPSHANLSQESRVRISHSDPYQNLIKLQHQPLISIFHTNTSHQLSTNKSLALHEHSVASFKSLTSISHNGFFFFFAWIFTLIFQTCISHCSHTLLLCTPFLHNKLSHGSFTPLYLTPMAQANLSHTP